MSLTLSAAAVFPLAAAANAAVLSVAIGARALARRSPAGIYGAAFLAGAALVAVLITLDHAGFDGGVAFPLAEGMLTLASGPTFVMFVAALLDRRLDARLLFAPLLAFVAAALIAPGMVLTNVGVEWLVAAQMAYTGLAVVLAYAPLRPDGRLALRARAIAQLAVVALAFVHVAQIARTVSDAAWLRDVVPYALGAVFFALGGLVYFGARAVALDQILSVRDVSSQIAEQAARLDAVLAARLSDAKLTLADAAQAAGLSPQAAARALAQAHGATFKDYLTRLRVREAERLLRDPAEGRTSMEAIGLLAGFGSRSAFYQAFRAHVGRSPAAFRAAETCPES